MTTGHEGSERSARLRWTGYALVDVGVAGICAFAGRRAPQEVTLDDLDRVSDFIAQHYFSGALDPYLVVVFMNSGYCGPNKKANPELYADVFRAHRVAPGDNVRVAAAGQRCVFSGEPASALAHRQHLPLFSAVGVMNFRPAGQTAVPVAAGVLVALQFAPMAARRAEGKMLAVHADEPQLMLDFARRYLDDNRRLLALALPEARAPVHAEFDREQPMWDPGRKRYKMADATGPRSLVIHDLTEIGAKAAPTDLRPRPVALAVYHLSNSGQGPSVEVLEMPSGLVTFVRMAARPPTREAWLGLATDYQPLQEEAGKAGKRARRGRRGRAGAPGVAGRPGWSRNPAFEDLCRVFEGGFTDRNRAAAWLGRHILGRLEDRRTGQPSRYKRTRARIWALAELFLKEVLGMKAGRIEAVKRFADKLAVHVHGKNDRRLFRAIAFAMPFELRRALLAAQRETARAGGELLFGLDEYATVWLHEDGDEWLVRDLVAIRVVERLHEFGHFAEHPEDALEAEAVESEAAKEGKV